MRRIISLLCLSFFIVQFACAEKEVVDPNAWDFGKAKTGEVLKHNFLFKNETKGVLNITGINTSCGCTASQADKRSLKPGESAAINVSFNSREYLGPVQQFVYVNTDNADLGAVRFIIKAEVIK